MSAAPASSTSSTPARVLSRPASTPLPPPPSTTTRPRQLPTPLLPSSYSSSRTLPIVLDLGSSVWKVGYSGEAAPRNCYPVQSIAVPGAEEECLWGLERGERDNEVGRVREERLKRGLREVWFSGLMCDPKSRKVIILENPLLPLRVKEMIARVLFDNLQVPSIAFTCAPLAALMAVGRITGLVVDCGHLETTVTPIFSARPLFHDMCSTPIASSQLNTRLRSLLLQFARYAPPPSSATSMTAPVPTRVPKGVLSDELIEEIKTRVCFVGEMISGLNTIVGRRTTSISLSEEEATSIVGGRYDESTDMPFLQHLESLYSLHSSATTISFRIPTPRAGTQSNVGYGWLLIPGWIRERAAEVLFEVDDPDAKSVTETVLDSLLSVSIDLRRGVVGGLLITGGTSMLPGFIPRLRSELLRTLENSSVIPPPATPSVDIVNTNDPRLPLEMIELKARLAKRLHHLRTLKPYSSLFPLVPNLHILNHPSPLPPFPALQDLNTSISGIGIAPVPNFVPALLQWVGGSLVGSLKSGGMEMTREDWIAAGELEGGGNEEARALIRDWTIGARSDMS